MQANHAAIVVWTLILLFGVVPWTIVAITALRRKFIARIAIGTKHDTHIPQIGAS